MHGDAPVLSNTPSVGYACACKGEAGRFGEGCFLDPGMQSGVSQYNFARRAYDMHGRAPWSGRLE